MNPPPSPSLFQAYLLPGERVLWTGQPKQGFTFRASDSFLIPFSLIWTGFVVVFFFTWQANGEGSPDFILVFFLLLGIYFTIGRFIHDAAIRKGLSYAVTDQRVLIAKRAGRLTSFDLRRLPKLELTEHADGTGSIGFETGPTFFNYGRAGGFDMWVPSLGAPYEFFRIQNPRKVYQLIREHGDRY